MFLEEVQKSKFAQTNDKRYYFEDGIIYLPFSHPYLLDIVNYKRNRKQKVESCINLEKKNLLKIEKEALLTNRRISTLQSIYLQMPEFRNLTSNKRCFDEAGKKFFFKHKKFSLERFFTITEGKIKYDGKFFGDILVVGQTGCGKTTFVQSLGKNKIFVDIKTVDWISKIELSQAREEQLRKTFYYASVGFHYPEDLGKFDTLLESLKDEKLVDNSDNNDVNNIVNTSFQLLI